MLPRFDGAPRFPDVALYQPNGATRRRVDPVYAVPLVPGRPEISSTDGGGWRLRDRETAVSFVRQELSTFPPDCWTSRIEGDEPCGTHERNLRGASGTAPHPWAARSRGELLLHRAYAPPSGGHRQGN
jgi:hypothetical protein